MPHGQRPLVTDHCPHIVGSRMSIGDFLGAQDVTRKRAERGSACQELTFPWNPVGLSFAASWGQFIDELGVAGARTPSLKTARW